MRSATTSILTPTSKSCIRLWSKRYLVITRDKTNRVMNFHSSQEDGNESSDEDDSFFTPLRALAATVKQTSRNGDPVVARVQSYKECDDHDREKSALSEGHKQNSWPFQWNWKSTVQSKLAVVQAPGQAPKQAPGIAPTRSAPKEYVIATQSKDEQLFSISSNISPSAVGMAEVPSPASVINASDEACVPIYTNAPSEILSAVAPEAESVAREPQQGVMDPISCLSSTWELTKDTDEAALDQILPDAVDEHVREGGQGQEAELYLLSDIHSDVGERAAAQDHVKLQEVVTDVEGPHCRDPVLEGAPESMATELCGPETSAGGCCQENVAVNAEVPTFAQEHETIPITHSHENTFEPDTSPTQSPEWHNRDDVARDSMSPDSSRESPDTFPLDLQLRLEVAESRTQEALAAVELEHSLRLMAEDGITALECALASSRSELAQVRAQARGDAGKMLEMSSMEYQALEALRSEQIRRERAEEAFCQVEQWMRATLEHVKHMRANEDFLQDQIQVLLQQRNQWWDNRWHSNEQLAIPPPEHSHSPDLRGMLEDMEASARMCNIPIATPTSPLPVDNPFILGEEEGSLKSRVNLLRSSTGVERYLRDSTLFHSASAEPFQLTPDSAGSKGRGENKVEAQSKCLLTLLVGEEKRSPAFAHFQHREQGGMMKRATKPVDLSTRMGKTLFPSVQ